MDCEEFFLIILHLSGKEGTT